MNFVKKKKGNRESGIRRRKQVAGYEGNGCYPWQNKLWKKNFSKNTCIQLQLEVISSTWFWLFISFRSDNSWSMLRTAEWRCVYDESFCSKSLAPLIPRTLTTHGRTRSPCPGLHRKYLVPPMLPSCLPIGNLNSTPRNVPSSNWSGPAKRVNLHISYIECNISIL